MRRLRNSLLEIPVNSFAEFIYNGGSRPGDKRIVFVTLQLANGVTGYDFARQEFRTFQAAYASEIATLSQHDIELNEKDIVSFVKSYVDVLDKDELREIAEGIAAKMFRYHFMNATKLFWLAPPPAMETESSVGSTNIIFRRNDAKEVRLELHDHGDIRLRVFDDLGKLCETKNSLTPEDLATFLSGKTNAQNQVVSEPESVGGGGPESGAGTHF